jgi:hypothetical protein
VSRVPKPGDILTSDDFNMIMEAVKTRRENFPEEPAGMSMALVFFNIGDRFAKLECREQEWTGYKSDIPETDGDPKCPNGHELMQGPPLKLGWLEAK